MFRRKFCNICLSAYDPSKPALSQSTVKEMEIEKICPFEDDGID